MSRRITPIRTQPTAVLSAVKGRSTMWQRLSKWNTLGMQEHTDIEEHGVPQLTQRNKGQKVTRNGMHSFLLHCRIVFIDAEGFEGFPGANWVVIAKWPTTDTILASDARYYNTKMRLAPEKPSRPASMNPIQRWTTRTSSFPLRVTLCPLFHCASCETQCYSRSVYSCIPSAFHLLGGCRIAGWPFSADKA